MAFQAYVKELKQRGVILAVSSKNEYDIAKDGFSHSDSVLSFEDFAAFKANWNPKSTNIETIANEINIGLDSLVFIDDTIFVGVDQTRQFLLLQNIDGVVYNFNTQWFC